MTIDAKSWAFRRDAKLADFLSMDELIKTLAETISCGGKFKTHCPYWHDKILDS